jgi:hypothetical protein
LDRMVACIRVEVLKAHGDTAYVTTASFSWFWVQVCAFAYQVPRHAASHSKLRHCTRIENRQTENIDRMLSTDVEIRCASVHLVDFRDHVENAEVAVRRTM